MRRFGHFPIDLINDVDGDAEAVQKIQSTDACQGQDRACVREDDGDIGNLLLHHARTSVH